MIGTAVSFLAIGVAELVAGGLKGTPASKSRAVAGIVTASLITLVAGSLAGWTASLLLVSAVSVAGAVAWIQLRVTKVLERRRAWLTLAALIAYLGVGVGSEGLWRSASLGDLEWLGVWLESLAFPALNMMEPQSLFLVVALFIFLSATANGIVRVVLIAAGTKTDRSEERLRGGRIIGVLERWMIFALMLSGEPTAAGLVVSAKSILRFPELTRVAGEKAASPAGAVDHVTEYFLLGSLVSWLMAAVLALLFVGPF